MPWKFSLFLVPKLLKKDQKKKTGGTVEYRIYNGLKNLIKLRKSTREFSDRNDVHRIDARNEHILAFIRQEGAYRTSCVFNLNDHPEPFFADLFMQYGFLPKEQLFDRISNTYLDPNHYNLMLQPHQSCWINIKPD